MSSCCFCKHPQDKNPVAKIEKERAIKAFRSLCLLSPEPVRRCLQRAQGRQVVGCGFMFVLVHVGWIDLTC